MEDFPEDVKQWLNKVGAEVIRARKLFPGNAGLLAALHEESGEVAKAMMDEPSCCVVDECVQVAAMACRLALEGDPTLDAVRRGRGAPVHPLWAEGRCDR